METKYRVTSTVTSCLHFVVLLVLLIFFFDVVNTRILAFEDGQNTRAKLNLSIRNVGVCLLFAQTTQ